MTVTEAAQIPADAKVEFRPWSDSGTVITGTFGEMSATGTVRIMDRIGAYHYLRPARIVRVIA